MSEKRTAIAVDDRRVATLVGLLYILGTAAGVTAAAIMPSIAAGGDVLGEIAAHRSESIVGALLVLTMGFALSALSAVFYPVGRRHSQALSMGYVVFRGALEGTLYVLTALIWLVLVALSASPGAAAPGASFLATTQQVMWDQLIALPFIVGVFMFYGLLHRARLVPRWLTIWGLAGAVLYVMAPLTNMAGLSFGFLMIPLAVQEMVLAVWLIAKGFNPGTTAEEDGWATGAVAKEERAACHVAAGWSPS
jgi:hypothetical protein